MITTIAFKVREINQISEVSDEMVLAETVFITVIGGLAGTLAAIVGSSLIESYVKGMLPYAPRGSLICLSPELIAFSLAFSLLQMVVPRWRNGDAIACRAIPIRFDSRPWLSM